MKRITNIIALMAVVLASFACSDEHDPVYVAGGEKAAQITHPKSGDAYVLDKANKFGVLDTFTWGKAEYALPTGVRYLLEIDKADGTFESPVRLTSLAANQASFTVEEMNNALGKLGLTPGEESTIKMRLTSNAYGGEEGNVPLEVFPTLHSEIIQLSVTPFEEDRAYPENLFMIGADFGGWNWDDAGVAEMVPVNGKPGEFWCIRYFNAGNGFKWAPKRAWANDFSALDTNTGFIQKDGNAMVEADGLYMVYVNMKSSEIYIEPAQVYGMGDCFGGWDEPVLFANNGEVAVSTTVGAGELRLYAGSTIATSDWWTREFIIIDGQILYRGNGGDQERVQVAAGKTVTLNFNAGTGTVK
ncbi:MAG: SusF/SusE family outer membrane protein [Tannerellaceae bacterium]